MAKSGEKAQEPGGPGFKLLDQYIPTSDLASLGIGITVITVGEAP